MSGRKMSKLDILREFGLFNSGNIVYLLRKEEHLNIKTEMVTRGDNTFAVYSLDGGQA
jgi:hypothetical protein